MGTSPRLRSILNHKKWYIAVYLLVSVHVIGVIGIARDDSRDFFTSLTPISLLLSAVLVASFHKQWNKDFLIFLLASYGVGLGVEMVGVNTGIPFGKYQYGSSLGIQLMGTPLIIGINWALLIYCTGIVAEKFGSGFYQRVLFASFFMVGIDGCMEPVAPALDLWSFEAGIAPVMNYAGWFVVSLMLQVLFQRLSFEKSNSIVTTYLVILLCFFISLLILL